MPSAAQSESGAFPHPDDVRAYVEYLRDLGVYDLLSRDVTEPEAALTAWAAEHLRDRGAAAANATSATPTSSPVAPMARPGVPQPRQSQAPIAAARPGIPAMPARPATPALSPFDQAQQRRATADRPGTAPTIQITPPTSAAPVEAAPALGIMAPDMPAPTPFNRLAPLPTDHVAPADKAAALQSLRSFIGDCTRCPLAYAGRHSIVFADGDPNARLMFVGEGPGADEDEQGLPFVGKAGQLLNNMIGAMGLKREQVYIANIVKCRPPKNRVPEPAEANTCAPFLLQQIDIVRPEVIVALGGTAATYLLGVKQSLTSLRGQWFDVRGAKCIITYHPAFLLRDPRQKGEAWKDLQRVMGELKVTPPARG